MPLLLVYGLGSSTLDWEKQIPALAARYRVIVPDVRGHGRSDKPRERYSIAGFSADHPLLILCTSRPEIRELRPDWGNIAELIVLEPLSEPESARLIGNLLGRAELTGLGRGDGPGVEQMEVGKLVGHVLGVGQAGHRVFGGEAGDVVGCLHRLAHRVGRKIGSGRVAAPLAQVDRDAQRLVAVALDVLQFALAHRHAQARAFGHLHAGVCRAQLPGVAQRHVGQGFELRPGVLEAGAGLLGIEGLGRGGGA